MNISKLVIFFSLLSCLIWQKSNAQSYDLGDDYEVYTKEEHQGIKSDKGKVVVPANYTKIGWSNNENRLVDNYIGYKSADLWGFLNIKNKKTTPAIYTSATPFLGDYIAVSKREAGSINRVYGVVSGGGKVIVSFKYQFLESVGEVLIAAKEEHGILVYGMINKKEETAFPFEYEHIKKLGNGTIAVTNQLGKTALFNKDRVRISEFDYEQILPFSDRQFIFINHGKKGVLGIDGKVKAEAIYRELKIDDKGMIRGKAFSRWNLLSAKNKLTSTYYYDDVKTVNKELFIVSCANEEAIVDKKNNYVTQQSDWQLHYYGRGRLITKRGGKYGVLKDYTKEVLSNEYDSIVLYDDVIVTKKQISRDYVWSLYDYGGKKLNSIYFDQIGGFSGGYFQVKKNGKWGFMNASGQEAIKARFDSVFTFENGIAKVKNRNKFGIINRFGDFIMPVKYDDIQVISATLFLFQENYSYGIFNRNLEETVQTYYKLTKLNYNVLEKNMSGKVGLLSNSGNRLLPTEYDSISPLLAEKIHVVRKRNAYAIVSKSGEFIMPLRDSLQQVFAINEGLIGIKKNGQYGFVDFGGKLRVVHRYDGIGRFSEGMAAIKLLGRWGYIDKAENIAIQPKYNSAGEFINGMAIIMRKGKKGLINYVGKEVLKAEYEKLSRTKYGNFISVKNDRFGLISKEGFEILFPKFQSIEDLGNGFFIVKNNNKYGLIDEKGISSIPMVYDHLVYDSFKDLYLAKKTADWKVLDSVK